METLILPNCFVNWPITLPQIGFILRDSRKVLPKNYFFGRLVNAKINTKKPPAFLKESQEINFHVALSICLNCLHNFLFMLVPRAKKVPFGIRKNSFFYVKQQAFFQKNLKFFNILKERQKKIFSKNMKKSIVIKKSILTGDLNLCIE